MIFQDISACLGRAFYLLHCQSYLLQFKLSPLNAHRSNLIIGLLRFGEEGSLDWLLAHLPEVGLEVHVCHLPYTITKLKGVFFKLHCITIFKIQETTLGQILAIKTVEHPNNLPLHVGRAEKIPPTKRGNQEKNKWIIFF